jgi:RimJ/RimL family protein N-acetyltransferase
MAVSLRQWKDSDLEPFAVINRDGQVMRYFPATLTREQSDALALRQRELIAQRGWGLWAVDVDGSFAGFTGLAVPTFEAAFTPCVELGWRLAREFWGRSIAYNAALLALDYAFTVLRLTEVVSFTAEVNTRSRRLMERLGFARDFQGDFLHPRIPQGHELRHHVLYRKQT